jgi:hypothetical protein
VTVHFFGSAYAFPHAFALFDSGTANLSLFHLLPFSKEGRLTRLATMTGSMTSPQTTHRHALIQRRAHCSGSSSIRSGTMSP